MDFYRILIIDDDEMHREVLSDYLQRAGLHAESAADGIQGIGMAKENPPDLILLDLQMPKMDGFAVLRRMQEDPALQNIPVLFLTSHDRPNLKVRALECGAEDYIVKPFDRAELMARVHAALRRSRRHAAHLQGQLRDMGLFDLLSTLEVGQKNARVELPELPAHIDVQKGRFLDAAFGSFAGADALVRIVLSAHGHFFVRFLPMEEDSGNEGEFLGGLLLDAVRRMDEWAHELPAGIGWDTWLEPNPAGHDDFLPWTSLPLPAGRFLALYPGDLDEGARRLSDLLSGSVLCPSSVPGETGPDWQGGQP